LQSFYRYVVQCRKHHIRDQYLQQSAELTNADFTIVSEIVLCLEPLKVAVNVLCRHVTSLISAQTSLKFYIIQLQKQNSELLKTLAEILKYRVKEIYGLHASVLQYLHSASARATATNVFGIPDKDAIKKFTRCLVGRLKNSVNCRWNNVSRRQHSH